MLQLAVFAISLCLAMYARFRTSGKGKKSVSITSYKGSTHKNSSTPHGKGKCTFSNGDEYVGEFKDGLIEGHGRYIFRSGGTYDGVFVKGLFEGRGVEHYNDGSVYDGEFVGGNRCGRGRMIYYRLADGPRSRDGRYRRGSSGGMLYEEVGRYEGEWLDGKKHGSGRWSSAKSGWTVEEVRFEEGRRIS
jgi:hypothetical protein